MPALLLALATLAADPAPAAPAPGAFDGTWLFDDFRRSAKDTEPYLVMVWGSAVAVAGEAFTLKDFLGSGRDYPGTVRFDPMHPTHVDLVLTAFDLTPLGFPATIPAGPRKGIFARDGDTLGVAFATEPDADRPTSFDDKALKVMRLTLKRAPAGVTGVPATIRVTVTGPDGKPAAGAALESGATFSGDARTEKSPPTATTGADGAADVPYAGFRGGSLFASDAAGRNVAFVPLSPAVLAGGALAVKLTPGREVVVPLTCPDMRTDELRNVNADVYFGGRSVAYAFTRADRQFKLVVPPGEYSLRVRSKAIIGRRVPLVVPPGDGPFTADVVVVRANAGALLVGQKAPEFTGVAAAVGGSVKLADYRGKYVVVEFWGYWCNPCVQTMPTWIAVHDMFKDKGVAVVGVHYDADGEVTTAEAYHAKLAGIKKQLWAGRDLPFPVALVATKDGDHYKSGPSAQYGVTSWPTTVLIDPDGVLVGEFDFRDAESAVKAVEALLAKRATGK